MKRMRLILSVILALSLIVCLCGGCDYFKSDEQLIRERIDDFKFAINAGDMEGAFECLDAKSRSTYEAMLNIGEGLIGGLVGFDISTSDLFALAMGTSSGDILSMEIQSIEITSETTATVTMSMTMSDDRMDLDESVESAPLEMVKEKGDWYIYAQMDWDSLL